MATASKVLKIEKSYVRSTPYGARNTFNGSNGLPWCGYFQHYCLKKASKALGSWIEKCSYPSVPAIWAYAKKTGRATYHGKPGDLIIFDWNGNKSPDHIGMLIKKTGGVYKTVEGNTSNVSQGNGGCVQIRYREPKWVLGFVRPPYSSAKKQNKAGIYTGEYPKPTLRIGSTGTNVKRWQRFLDWAGYEVKIDGQFGAMTRRATIAFQKDVKIACDGIVGANTIGMAKLYKR